MKTSESSSKPKPSKWSVSKDEALTLIAPKIKDEQKGHSSKESRKSLYGKDQ